MNTVRPEPQPRLLDLFACAGEIAEAIPPAYTEHIGRQLAAHLATKEAAA